MSSGAVPSASASSRSASRPSRSPSMMRCLSRSSTGQPLRSSFSTWPTVDVVEHVEQLRQRVVPGGLVPAVVDEVEADLALLLGDLVERHDAGRVHDGRVEPGLDALVQEHRVEDVAGRRLQAEATRSTRRATVDTPGQLGLDAADGLDGVHAVAAQVVVAGREREGERVEDEVAGLEAVAVDGEVVDAVRDAQLPLDVAGLALLVDEQADDGGAVLAGQACRPGRGGCPARRRPRGWRS